MKNAIFALAITTLTTVIALAAAPAAGNTYRIGCGVGGAANPHNGSMYVAIYRNAGMSAYRMMVWKQGLISIEEDIVVEESSIEPTGAWPQLSATMKGEHNGAKHTFKMTIDKTTHLNEDRNDHGNFDFTAEGSFEMSLAPGKKFALVCDGVFSRE